MTNYQVWTDSGIGIVEVIGDLSSSESVAYHAAIRSAVDKAKTPNLVIVCNGVGRFALGPIGVTITTSQALRGRGGRIALAGPDARVRRVLRIGGITDIEAYPDLESALTALSNPQAEP